MVVPRARRGRGEGAIYFDKVSGLWVAAVSWGYDARGKRRRRKVYGHSKEEVRRKLAEMQRDFMNGAPIPPDRLTIGEWVKEWLASKRVRETTLAKYEAYAKRIIDAVGGVRLKDFDARRVEALYRFLEADGLEPKTVHGIASVLRAAFAAAVRRDLIPRDPTRQVDMPKLPHNEARFLTKEEVRAFSEAARGERLEALFVLLLHTGLRLGEALGLPWEAVDLEAGTLTVRQALHEVKGKLFLGPPKTKAALRTITLTAPAVQALKAQKRRQAEERLRAGPKWQNAWNLVFTDHFGGPLRRSNIARRDVKRVIKKARCEALERLLSAGTPPVEAEEAVSKLLEGVTPPMHSATRTPRCSSQPERIPRRFSVGSVTRTSGSRCSSMATSSRGRMRTPPGAWSVI